MSNISLPLTSFNSTSELAGGPAAAAHLVTAPSQIISASTNDSPRDGSFSSEILEKIKSVQFIKLIESGALSSYPSSSGTSQNESFLEPSVSALVGQSIKIDPVVSLLTDGALNASASFLFPSSSTTSSSTFINPADIIEPEEHGQWSVEDAFVEGSHLWSLLVAGYSLVFAVGVIGNAILLAALCGSGSRARALPVRNHLMVNLAAADLLVTAVCVPISACAAASHACWPSFLVSWMCQLGPLLQRTPVAASTLSLALLSLDRWAALRHPRFAQRFREKRFVAMSMGCIWILASLVSVPTFWAREWDSGSSASFPSDHMQQQNVYNSSAGHSFPGANGSSGSANESTGSWFPFTSSSTSSSWHWTGVCREQWTNTGIQLAYAATYLGTAFVSPALIVAACHASVSQKLTAQLQVLSGAAGSGDKARQRPKHVIIVARDLNNASNNGAVNGNGVLENAKVSRKVVPCDPNSDEDDVFLRMQIQADLESFRQISQFQQSGTAHGNRHGLIKPYAAVRRSSPGNLKNNLPLRAARRETSIIRAHRRLRKKLSNPLKPPPPLLPTYSSQSFRSRRRAANLLAALAGVFVFCWAPYVVCALWDMLAKEKSIVRRLIPFALFLGHAHSAINPVVSWRLNRSAFVRFQQQPCLHFCGGWTGWCMGGGRGGGNGICTCCSCRCCCGNSSECDNTMSPSNTARNNQSIHRPHVGSSSNCYPCGRRRGACMLSSCCSCCCTCTGFGRFRRRSSSPDGWARNSSTNEAALGAFHPKYLSRLPVPDPISKCHTSHFLK